MKSRIRKFLSLLILPGIIAGCATPDYRVPDGAPEARLRTITTVMGITSVYAFGKEDCRTDAKLVSILSPLAIPSQPRIGMPGLPEETAQGAMSEMKIAADRPFISSMFYSHGSVYTGWVLCDVSTVFTPDPGKDYEMIYETVRSSDANGCTARIVRLDNRDGQIIRTPQPSVRRAKFQCRAEEVYKIRQEAKADDAPKK